MRPDGEIELRPGWVLLTSGGDVYAGRTARAGFICPACGCEADLIGDELICQGPYWFQLDTSPCDACRGELGVCDEHVADWFDCAGSATRLPSRNLSVFDWRAPLISACLGKPSGGEAGMRGIVSL